MRKNLSAMVSGRRKDAGYTFIEIIGALGIIAVLAGLGVLIFLTVFGNANASNATKVGVSTQQAAFSHFTQYGDYPTTQAELETYLGQAGDDVPSDTLPNNTIMTVGLDGSTTPASPVVVIQSSEFNDGIIVRRAGSVEVLDDRCDAVITDLLTALAANTPPSYAVTVGTAPTCA